jgi:23S rRNA pseudouridine1911/1915/1917 synthase
MALIQKQTQVDNELAGRADRVVQRLTAMSRSEVRGLFDHGCVTINGSACDDGGALVRRDDRVEVKYDAHRRYREREKAWEDDAFKIVFEDKHLIVVDKSAGVLTVPANPGETGSLVHAISSYLEHRGARDRAQLVHRLDRGASGLLVFGKNRAIAAQLQSQFEARKPEREYMAIVNGVLSRSEGTFESYLATSKSLQQYSTHRPGEGQIAITHYRLSKVARGASCVQVWLETGRRNQIRVHFAEAGNPVLGDPRYAPEKSAHSHWRVKRLALHAAVLGFHHPISGQSLRFESPMPAPMKAFLGIRNEHSNTH